MSVNMACRYCLFNKDSALWSNLPGHIIAIIFTFLFKTFGWQQLRLSVFSVRYSVHANRNATSLELKVTTRKSREICMCFFKRR